MINRVLIAVLAMALTGHAVAGSIWKTGITEEDFQKKVDAGPALKPLVKTHFDARPAGTKIEVYYKRFSIMHLAHNPDAPNAHHFIMGKPGEPSWGYVKIAEIEIYRAMRADPMVIALMKKEAAAIGGDALTDCQRDPLLLEDSQTRNRQDWRATDFEVVGYQFSCTIVRRKD
ncbi:MAG TPA: hypothetical protein VEW08_05920 [Steroidobacteraceae bacterium]|nr:hypothetical protein [Steroidobacteraceae bacterium]